MDVLNEVRSTWRHIASIITAASEDTEMNFVVHLNTNE